MSQLHSHTPWKTVPGVYITYKRKRRVSTGGSSLLSGLQDGATALISPKKEVEASILAVEDTGTSAVGEGFLRNFVNQDTAPLSKRFQNSTWQKSAPMFRNVYSRKRKLARLIGDAGALAGKEVRVKNFVNPDPSPSPKHLASVGRIPPSPIACKEIEQVGLNSPLPLQVDASALIALKEAEASVAVVEDGEALEEASVDEIDSPDDRWRKALEHMLQLPDMKGGGSGGIQSCIHSALRFGPSVCTTKSKLVHISGDVTDPKDQFKDKYKMQEQSQRVGSSAGGASDKSKSGLCSHADVNNISLMCQNVLSKILSSKSFVSLCDFIYGTFRDKKASEMLDFSLINARMINGNYDRSPEQFDKDIEQVRERIQKIGQETMLIASNLPNISLASLQKQVADDMIREVDEQIFEGAGQAGGGQRNSIASNTAQYESDRSSMPEPTEASCLYKIYTCKQCGTDADIKNCLICDGCEAMYHFSCIVPAQKEIPMQSWYCAACAMNGKKPDASHTSSRGTSEPVTNIGETSEPVLTRTQPEGLHPNCTVCDRLEVSEAPRESTEISNTNVIVFDSPDSSDSSHQSSELPEPSGTAISRLCKKCGTCEDVDRQFLTCAHTHCPFKFYHIRCLKYSQTGLLQKKNHSCWYCPSCLCRSCLSDKDDTQLVLCDTCDEGYHIYCMTPPLDSIPRGKWYCISCTAAKAREGMRRYEHVILQQHGRKDARQSSETRRSTDLLLGTVGKGGLLGVTH